MADDGEWTTVQARKRPKPKAKDADRAEAPLRTAADVPGAPVRYSGLNTSHLLAAKKPAKPKVARARVGANDAPASLFEEMTAARPQAAAAAAKRKKKPTKAAAAAAAAAQKKKRSPFAGLAAGIQVDEVRSLFSTAELQYPGNDEVQVELLVEFLENELGTSTEGGAPAWTRGQSFGELAGHLGAADALPPAVTSTIKAWLKKRAHAALERALVVMMDAMPGIGGRSAVSSSGAGIAVAIQLVVGTHPRLAASARVAQYLLRPFDGTPTRRSLGLVFFSWMLAQASPAVFLETWSASLLPLAFDESAPKHGARLVTDALEWLLAGERFQQLRLKGTTAITPDVFEGILALAHDGGREAMVAQAAELVLAQEAMGAADYFAVALPMAAPADEAARRAVCGALVALIARDAACVGTWADLLADNIAQSHNLARALCEEGVPAGGSAAALANAARDWAGLCEDERAAGAFVALADAASRAKSRGAGGARWIAVAAGIIIAGAGVGAAILGEDEVWALWGAIKKELVMG